MKRDLNEFKIKIDDIITPFSCSVMVVEFIKYVIYQKQLIPYPYERLKMYVDKRRKMLDPSQENAAQSDLETIKDQRHSKYSLVSRKYFKTTESAYNSLENIFEELIIDKYDGTQLITNELALSKKNRIEEVVLLFGNSFTNPRDVFRLRIPTLDYSHSATCLSPKRNWRNLFRTMVNTQFLDDLVSNNICTGNLHVMLKMKTNTSVIESSSFVPLILRGGFKLPTNGNQTLIVFDSQNAVRNCACGVFQIFEDIDQQSTTNDANEDDNGKGDQNLSANSNVTIESHWYQMKDTVKYFSDVLFNGTSVTDIWMNPKLLE